MPIQSSFPKVADQILSFNKNLIDILSKLNTLTTTTESTVNIQTFDENGTLRNFSLPSITSLKNEIDRLNNNINSIYNIDGSGALIQLSNSNKYKRIVTVDLNREPTPIGTLGVLSTFTTKPNWFFDSMVDPMLQVDINLDGKIDEYIDTCMVRRYIINFESNSNGFTNRGQSALNSFNQLFNSNADILLSEFENWHKTTVGVLNPDNPKYDESTFKLEPNTLLYEGVFTVVGTQEDRLNRKLWYVLNTLDYKSNIDGRKQLSIGDEIVVNSIKGSTKYRVLEVSSSELVPRVRFERIEGLEPIPVGVGTLKIYSPVIYNKTLRVSVGYNEYNVLFIKPIRRDNNVASVSWSLGTGFNTNTLRLVSDNNSNGLTMDAFYREYVYDYGSVLKDLVTKNIPKKLALTPNTPTLDISNFRVVPINKHLTDSANISLIKQKHNYQNTLKSEIIQLEDAISSRNKKYKTTRFSTDSAKRQFDLETDELISKKDNKSRLLSTITQEIIDLTKDPVSATEPKFRLRGFWAFPNPVTGIGTLPQEVIQFIVQYRYVSNDGIEQPIEQFNIDTNTRGSFSNWNEYKTDVRKRIYDPSTDSYFWMREDIENPDIPNINQLDLPIQLGERIEFRIKSISEVGFPDSITDSAWSEVLSIDFPIELNNIVRENEVILQEANKDDLRLTLLSELNAIGLTEHLADTVTIGDVKYLHDSAKILSGFKDSNGNILNLFEYLRVLEDKVRQLEDRIADARGLLEVYVVRNGEERLIKNNENIAYYINVVDYMVPTRTGNNIYENRVYFINDFSIRIRNNSNRSPLGLLANKTYLSNPAQSYDRNSPQVFWVNPQGELLTSDVSGQTRTQIDNQFIWSSNIGTQKISDNIGNLFTQNNSNSITDVLSSNEYNIGYNETTILRFVRNNKSLLEREKWIDKKITVQSKKKFLCTVHPVIKDLESLAENTNGIKTVEAGRSNDIIIPIVIYFKVDATDEQTIRIRNRNDRQENMRYLKLHLENEAENRPFVFNLLFHLNIDK
jgi:hypothetical protein